MSEKLYFFQTDIAIECYDTACTLHTLTKNGTQQRNSKNVHKNNMQMFSIELLFFMKISTYRRISY